MYKIFEINLTVIEFFYLFIYFLPLQMIYGFQDFETQNFAPMPFY